MLICGQTDPTVITVTESLRHLGHFRHEIKGLGLYNNARRLTDNTRAARRTDSVFSGELAPDL